ncbi:FtsX-like permease family protein [Nakamurella panacisegetis]|uniref:FtsX-like permease family protein n=2 Tax=Nakamurella panacisegetis TaxID=1090615 RepID=A0A1H0QC62_9ACTN|nr:FtsX-like permease family protein [Nakamurella panacisegetis]
MTESRGLRSFLVEIGIGTRLAVRGGRPGWTRLLLTAVGLGLCVVVLLLGTSITGAMAARETREAALAPRYTPNQQAPDGASEFEIHQTKVPWNDRMVTGNYVAPLTGVAALPPGLSAYPGVGDVIVSPALQALLDSSGGVQLRRMIPGRVVGVIEDSGLTSPTDLRFYAGIRPTGNASVGSFDTTSMVDWAWGNQGSTNLGPYYEPTGSNDFYFQMLASAGAALVLVPLAIFVLIISRLGTAGREQRLAAIRLLGGSRPQVRRLIAGESLVGAALGVMIGVAGFFVARLGARWLVLGGDSFFPSDLRPPTAALTAVGLGIPLIAVATTVLGTGRIMTDPLSTVRNRPPGRPRLIWRLALTAVGLGSIALFSAGFRSGQTFGLLAGSVVLVLLTVPVLLPWLLRVTLARVRPHRPAAQLAIRRLQIESTTSARVVAGAATVLAGAIALQYLIGLIDTSPVRTVTAAHRGSYVVNVQTPTPADITDIPGRLKASGDYTDIRGGAILQMTGSTAGQSTEAYIGSCAQITANLGITNCRDGDSFRLDDGGTGGPAAGSRWTPTFGDTSAGFVVPDRIRRVTVDELKSQSFDFAPQLVLTVGALGPNGPKLLSSSFIYLLVRPTTADPATLRALRIDLADLTWRADVSSFSEVLPTSGRLQLASTIRVGLIAAGLLTLVVSAAGLVLVAVEDLNRRRRALTLLVAAGVPRATVARSLLIGSAVPAAVGTVVAAVVGIGLSAFLQVDAMGSVRINGWTVALYAAIEFTAILSVTALTLPAVRPTTRPETLRTL